MFAKDVRCNFLVSFNASDIFSLNFVIITSLVIGLSKFSWLIDCGAENKRGLAVLLLKTMKY